jgi:hypothetical protein
LKEFTKIGDFAFRTIDIRYLSISEIEEPEGEHTHFIKVHLKSEAYCVFTGEYEDCLDFFAGLFN